MNLHFILVLMAILVAGDTPQPAYAPLLRAVEQGGPILLVRVEKVRAHRGPHCSTTGTVRLRVIDQVRALTNPEILELPFAISCPDPIAKRDFPPVWGRKEPKNEEELLIWLERDSTDVVGVARLTPELTKDFSVLKRLDDAARTSDISALKAGLTKQPIAIHNFALMALLKDASLCDLRCRQNVLDEEIRFFNTAPFFGQQQSLINLSQRIFNDRPSDAQIRERIVSFLFRIATESSNRDLRRLALLKILALLARNSAVDPARLKVKKVLLQRSLTLAIKDHWISEGQAGRITDFVSHAEAEK